MDRLLVYGTGGVAFGGWDVSIYMAGGSDEALFEKSSLRTGWIAGGGFEYALDKHWALKGEYLFADFGNITGSSEFSGGGAGFIQEHRVELTTQVVRVGMNYKF